jgi:glycosyltransferase involved in cell wall biosynthesis
VAHCKISILIPVNSQKFLAEALRSVQSQSISHDLIEIVLILDRIDLGLVKEIIKVEIKDIPVLIYESSFPGIVSALNLGLEKSNGELIARLDHDDVMLRNRLNIQYEFLEKNLDFAAVGGQIQLMSESGLFLGKAKYPYDPKSCKQAMFYRSPIPHPAVMFRKKIVLGLGSYRDNIPEDWDLWIRLIENSKVGNLKSPVINYRIHSEQLSRISMYQMGSARKAVITSLRLRRKGLYDLPPKSLNLDIWYEQVTREFTFGFLILLSDTLRWFIWDSIQFLYRIIRHVKKQVELKQE